MNKFISRFEKNILEGEINSLKKLEELGVKIKEKDLIKKIYPNLFFYLVKSSLVKKTTKGGIKRSHKIILICGDKKEVIGFGIGKAKEFKKAYLKAERNSILNMIYVKKGCGSKSCLCNDEHSINSKIFIKFSGVRLKFIPAEKGTGRKCSEIGKKISSFCGIKDIHIKNLKSKNIENYVKAFIKGLKKLKNLK